MEKPPHRRDITVAAAAALVAIAAPALATEAPSQPKARRFRCVVCQHIYDPREGDPDAGIAPGTRFEDIPETWVCPECGATKADFEPIDD